MKKTVVSAFALAWGVFAIPAQSAVSPYQEYDKLVRSAEMVQPLKSDLFGDQVSLYNGATEFSATDIDIPGNNALPVRLGRTFRVELRNDSDNLGGFGAWDLEVPYVYGVFPDTSKWNVSGNQATNRCSQLFYPAVETPFYVHEVWTGTKLHIPGRGDQSMMWNENNPQPTDGAGYYWNTRDNVRFKCTSMLNYPGQGFIAVDSDGVQYVFNYAIERAGGVVRKQAAAWGEVARNRTKIYLMATQVRDRHGNYVNYEYSGDQLTRIVSSDGRVISLTYLNGQIQRASANGRNWDYTYSTTLGFGQRQAKALLTVTQPDQKKWEYQYGSDLQILGSIQDGSVGGRSCLEPQPDHGSFQLIAKHPSGAIGTFNFDYLRHGISGTPATACVLEGVVNGTEYWTLVIPDYFFTFSLTSKTIAGVGLSPRTWQYYYGDPLTGRMYYSMSALNCRGACDEAKSQLVVQPDGTRMEYVYGALFNYNDGRLLATYTRDAAGKILRAEINEYVDDNEVSQMPFPATFGISSGSFDHSSMYNRPIKASIVLQGGDIPGPVEFQPPPPPPPPPPPDPSDPPPEQCVPMPPYYVCNDPALMAGDEPEAMSIHAASSPVSSSTASAIPTGTADVFANRVLEFDYMARPARVVRESSLGHTRTDLTTYYDDRSRWVMGQIKSVTNLDTGLIEAQNDYWPSTSMLQRTWRFGKPQQYLTYNADGTVASVVDGNNNVITLSGWKRGIPQSISHPATPDQPSGTTESAVVDDNGWVRSITDENEYTTAYGYDEMGRLSRIVYPTSDSTNWLDTTLSFTQVDVGEYGIAPGHWRQLISTGNSRKAIYYDALWQPLLQETYDAADPTATRSLVARRFDHDGRATFQSYPVRALTTHTDANSGLHTLYDPLGRPIELRQNSELGDLFTTTQYLTGLRTQVMSPRQHVTTTSYMAYDRPTFDWPKAIVHPEGAYTDIDRHVFGNPRWIRRRNADGSAAITRSYIYDSYQQLCKRVEPETAATLMDYDGAGNLAWTAAGQSLTSAACDRDAVPSSAKAVRTYDARNRLKALIFSDGNGDLSWQYYPDGLPQSVTALNDAGSSQAVSRYSYNKRRLLTAESLGLSSGEQWAIGYGYNTHGHLTNHSYPSGVSIDYAPNALGQATQAGSYATGVSYFPNGAIRQFTYGNGLVHTLEQNTRQLPDRSVDAYDGIAVLNDGYDYDANGNVAGISDGLPGARGARDLFYDGLDRLIAASSPMFGDAVYGYDSLDNLTQVSIGTRNETYHYDSRHLLTNIIQAGSTVTGLDYDPQGNLKNKDGQVYRFDYGNRLRSVVGKETYRYDAHGRRVQASHASLGSIFSLYGQDGVLRFQRDDRTGKAREYIYLGGSLVARVSNASTAAVPILTLPSISNNGDYTAQWSTVPGATRYELIEQINGGSWSKIQDAASTSKAFSNRAAGSYGYRVRGCFALICNGWSATAIVVVNREPTAPLTLSAPSVGPSGNYTVGWNAATTATSYTLEESVNGGSWSAAYTGSALSQAFASRAAGQYAYRAKACNSIGCGGYSATVTVNAVYAPSASPTLSAPSFNATGSYPVNWSAVAGATSYQLEEQSNGGTWSVIHNAAGTSIAISGKGSGSYGYRVRGCNVVGCGPTTAVATTTVVLPPTSAPSINVPATSYTGSYIVGWGGVSAATSYQLEEQVNGGGWTLVYNAGGASLAISGKGTASYGYRVRACNSGGCGPVSSTATVAVTLPPASAPSISAPGTNTNGSYTVSWGGLAGASSYQLEEQANGGGWTLIHNAADASKAIGGKATGSYGYRVRACNVGGCGPYSSTVTVAVTLPPSSAPALYMDGYADEGYPYSVSWTSVAGATSYQLDSQMNGGTWYQVQSGAQTSWTSPGQGASLYGYRVRACNWVGCGPYSSTQYIEVRSTCGWPPCSGGDPPALQSEDPPPGGDQ